MNNEKKSMIAMMAVTVVAVAVCAGTIIFFQQDSSEKDEILIEETVSPVIIKKQVQKPKVAKVQTHTVKKAALTDEEKKKKEADKWREAMEEFQTSKMGDLIKQRMAGRVKEYLKELFDKYNISEKDREAIGMAIADAQMQSMQVLMMSRNQNNADEAARAERAEKLAAIDAQTEESIRDLAGDGFLADAKEKRSSELRNNYMKRIDSSLKNNKMSDDQRSGMDALYAENQITETEVYTLPPEEIQRRKDNIKNGAQDILSPDQYKVYQKTSGNPFSFGGLGGGRRRGRKPRR